MGVKEDGCEVEDERRMRGWRTEEERRERVER